MKADTRLLPKKMRIRTDLETSGPQKTKTRRNKNAKTNKTGWRPKIGQRLPTRINYQPT